MTRSLLDQLPRFSEYDPGALGEGSLDPLGLGAIADRIAEVLAPGVRARMVHPRYVTLSAVGAYACHDLRDEVSADGKTTFDIAYEWMVVEALVRHGKKDDARGLPGSQKTGRALRLHQRLTAGNYLAGPRVFGFTGVHRPFSRDTGVLTSDGAAGEAADSLLRAWEQEAGMDGFLSGGNGSPGRKLRVALNSECLAALEAGEVTAPPTGWLLQTLARVLVPRGADAKERSVLRAMVRSGDHDTRNELTARLSEGEWPPDIRDADLARALLDRVGEASRRALRAAIAFEEAATRIENAFRRVLAHAASHGGALSVSDAALAPGVAELAPAVGDLARKAAVATAELDEVLGTDVSTCLSLFDQPMQPHDLVDALIRRHQAVQEEKGKRMWIDPVKDRWLVRLPYRNQPLHTDDELWIHPMRLRVLVSFLAATA